MHEFHIPGIILMENAARGLADATVDELQSLYGRSTGRLLILCGGGNNGGDGLAAARHLHNCSCDVHIGLTIDPVKYSGDALINYTIVQAMGLPTFSASPASLEKFEADLILDAIFGTGLSSPPREPFGPIVAIVNASGIPVIAVDLPSGLDCDTGAPLGPTLKARRTVTFAAMKQGFSAPGAQEYLGHVTVADIGCPRELLP